MMPLFKSYKTWLKSQAQALSQLSKGACVIDTPLGKVEINYKNSEKKTVDLKEDSNQQSTLLIVHGGGGGHDQGLACFDMLFGEGYNLLSFSRPGYCHTPLSSGASFEAQADLMAAILETLNIQSVVLIGASAGGGALYQFALRHPDNLTALVAIDALSMQYLMPANAGKLAEMIFMSNTGVYLLNKLMNMSPKSGVQTILKQESLLNKEEIAFHTDRILSEPDKLKMVLNLFRTMQHYKAKRKQGVDNDMLQGAKQTKLPLDKITAPALVIHGTADSDVIFWQGVYAYETIPQAERYWIEKGSHLAFWLGEQANHAQACAKAFIKKHI